MRTIRQTRVRAFAAAIFLTLADGAAQAATNCSFPTSNSVDCQMTNGARWELSWVNDAKKGLVLNQITLTAKPGAPRTRILESASLAQVLVAYDNNSVSEHLVSDAGLPLTPLTATDDCPGTLLQNGGAGSFLVCQMIVPRGYAWRGSGQLQGESLVIFGVSAGDNTTPACAKTPTTAPCANTYIHQWVFQDDGTIQPMLGVSGELDPARDSTATTGWPISAATRYATNRFHTAYWRLDFALGAQSDTLLQQQSNDQFQQLEYTPANGGYDHNQVITNISTEGQFNISPDAQRFWVVKDTNFNIANGQNISFEIVPQHTSLHRGGDAFTSGDVYITQNKPCEQFASHNPTTNPLCAEGLPQFVNSEALTDPVAWVGTTWHQVPRAEDESDIQTHWQGFILAPRDLTMSSPFL